MTDRLRLVLFGSGSPLSLAVLDVLRERHDVAAVVLPKARRRLLGGIGKNALAQSAYAIPMLEFGPEVHGRLSDLRADLFCIASFPHLIRAELLAVPRLGALNVHPSLLPRHRGPDPLFWSYFDDDRETGVTIHWVDERVDAGDIVAQLRAPIERGRPVTDLYADLSRLAAQGIVAAIDSIARGTATRHVQDEALASLDPRPLPDRFVVDLAAWPAERVWHFLSGIGCRRMDLLRDASGAVFLHGPAIRFGEGASEAPGTIQPIASGYRIHCADGWVEVASAPLRGRLWYWLRGIAQRFRPRARRSSPPSPGH